MNDYTKRTIYNR